MKEKTQTALPDWEKEKQKIEEDKIERGIGKDEFYSFIEGENNIEIDLTQKPISFVNKFGKDRKKLYLTDGKVIAVSVVLYDSMLDKIILAKGKGETSCKIKVLRIGTGATDTKYKVMN